MLYLSSANDSQSVLDAENTQGIRTHHYFDSSKTSTDNSEVTENYYLFSGTLRGQTLPESVHEVRVALAPMTH